MKIKSISCTQFAGIRDCNLSFTEGINVICGANESGKSTTANLIARTLFQKAKIDRRSDKAFCELYFPGVRRDSDFTGDFADGKITFETNQGIYTLSKEWGTDARCTLSTPNGIVRDQKKIDEILKDALLYGEGVYSDLLLSSQHNTDAALQTLLDSSKKTDAKAEITDVVSQAFAESDGISEDSIEQAIQAKIDEIAGKHWDVERDAPVRKTGAGRWSNGLGEILKAYYSLDDAKSVLSEISRLEADADQATNDYISKDNEAHIAENAYNQFSTYASSLILQSERKKAMKHLETELQKIQRVLADWPTLEQTLAQAQKLLEEKTSRDLLDKYESAQKVVDEIKTLGAADVPYPDDAEITEIRNAQREITSLENKLCGMNLRAAIKMCGNHTIEVISVRTGQRIDISDGIASIGEAVKIVIPDVMEMQLAPANVDVSSIDSQITEKQQKISDIYAKYEVNNLEELENLAKSVSAAKTKRDIANNRLAQILGTDSFENLKLAAVGISTDIRSNSEIENIVAVLCGGSDLSKFITARETVISSYESEYGSLNDLKAKAFDLNTEIQKVDVSTAAVENIPVEYATITDPEAQLERLKTAYKLKQELREKALNVKTASESKLESFKENLQSDPVADVEQAERSFNEQKSLLSHWLHIKQVFYAQKENLNANPMQDIADSFSRYLGVISGGKVSSEFPHADKLAMQVYSDNRLLDYGKLSEGTKETVSLAFRLAVLDHLFPDGGGIIVLDDPFTDMDLERAVQGCELIKECAKHHQVIFLTCREEYLAMLGGNAIRI